MLPEAIKRWESGEVGHTRNESGILEEMKKCKRIGISDSSNNEDRLMKDRMIGRLLDRLNAEGTGFYVRL